MFIRSEQTNDTGTTVGTSVSGSNNVMCLPAVADMPSEHK